MHSSGIIKGLVEPMVYSNGNGGRKQFWKLSRHSTVRHTGFFPPHNVEAFSRTSRMEFSKRRREWSVSEFPCQGSRYYWGNYPTFKISQMTIFRIIIIIGRCWGIVVVSCLYCSCGGGGVVVRQSEGLSTLHVTLTEESDLSSRAETAELTGPQLRTDRQSS